MRFISSLLTIGFMLINLTCLAQIFPPEPPPSSLTIMLFDAIGSGDATGTQAALQLGADVNSPDDDYVGPPLYFACQFNRSQVVRELLRSGADVHCLGENGWGPLHRLLVERFSDQLYPWVASEMLLIISDLLKAGADINLPDKHGRTPLFYSNDETRVYQYLIIHGANASHTDTFGLSPTQYMESVRKQMAENERKALFRKARKSLSHFFSPASRK